MVGDIQLRNLADATIDAYTYHVDKFCQFFGKPADQLGPEEIRQYQLYLVNEKKVSWSSFNQAVCGLRFLYEITLQRPWAVRHIPFGKRPKKLPVVLSNEEASRLLQCIDNPSIEPSPPRCPRCDVPMRCMDQQRRPSWKFIFARSIYDDATLYSPMHHIYSRAPPAFPQDE